VTTSRALLDSIDRHYPLSLADAWDSVGFISGSWTLDISRVLVTVDITFDVVTEAHDKGAQCIVAHHPLLLSRHTPATEPYKYRLINRANMLGINLMNAHTNADHARPGVTDAIADVLDILDTEAIIPTSDDTVSGVGRIGQLIEPMSLGRLVTMIENRIPHSQPRLSGDPSRVVETVAVCGGAGDFLLPQVRSTSAEAYITSDLRHHPVSEHLEAGGCPVIDINHAVAESLWLADLAAHLTRDTGVEVLRSESVTAVWNRN